MKATTLALALLALPAAPQAQDIRSDIDALNAQWVATFNRGDAAGMALLYTEQATLLPSGAPLAKGRAAIQAAWQAAFDAGFRKVAVRMRQLDQFGDAAREIGEFSLDAPGGRMDGKYVVLWRRVGGAWQLDTDIWNPDR